MVLWVCGGDATSCDGQRFPASCPPSSAAGQVLSHVRAEALYSLSTSVALFMLCFGWCDLPLVCIAP